jgi:hypothetical protein
MFSNTSFRLFSFAAAIVLFAIVALPTLDTAARIVA